MNNEDGPFFGLEYRRLLKSELREQGTMNSRYFYTGFDFAGSGNPVVIPESLSLISITDSSVLQRASGAAAADYNLKIGVERQNRLFSGNAGLSGLQLVVSYYGILGYTRKIDQYAYVVQTLPASPQTDFDPHSTGDSQTLAGLRISEYLRIGAGLSFGFDWVLAINSRSTIFAGLHLGLFNVTGAFLVNSETRQDPDEIYTTAPKAAFLHGDPAINFRFGVGF